MLKRFSWIALELLIVWQLGCGGQSPKPGSSGPPPTPPLNISISPASAMLGSPDLTLTVAGSNTFTFRQGGVFYSTVVWSQGGIDTPLSTTFISSSQLTATVPAELLASAVRSNVRVEIWDRIEGTRTSTSNSVPFQVEPPLPPPRPTPSITSISPSTVAAGSPDVTITIDGSNFGHFGLFVWSSAFWTTNGNLHGGTWLQATIISDTQLRAVIPAALLQSSTSGQIVVMNGDVLGMTDGYFGYPRSNSVTFTVTP